MDKFFTMGKFIYCALFFGLFFAIEVQAYTPPLGIPAPSFGVDESHEMYSGLKFDFNANGILEDNETYQNAGNGPYTHYIDNNAQNCSDSANPFGNEAKPRCTIPASIGPGSVIELHGGPYTALNLTGGIAGTAQKPIFVRGYDRNNKTVITGRGTASNSTVTIQNASYVILENLSCDGSGLDGAVSSGAFSVRSPSDHIVIRYSEMHHYPMPDFCVTKGTACWYGSVNGSGSTSSTYDNNPLARTSHLVWYKNNIHDNAIYPLAYETGRHGIMAESGSEHIWILENKIERSGDDGVQIFHFAGGGHGPIARNIYIGGNEVNDMGENAFDIKQSYDVVISQNKIWGFSKTSQLGAGSDGSAIVLNNDDPSDRLWVIYNEIYGSNIGIRSQAKGTNYIFGNIFHDIVRYPGAVVPISTGNSSGCAIVVSGYAGMAIHNNTIDSVDCGISVIKGVVPATVQNNIISNLNEPTGYAILYNTSPILNTENNLLYNSGMGLKKAANLNGITGSDPVYANRASKNFSLTENSAAIDRSLFSTVVTTFSTLYGLSIAKDTAGLARPQGAAWDIGAFEYKPTAQIPVADTTPPSAPNGVIVE